MSELNVETRRPPAAPRFEATAGRAAARTPMMNALTPLAAARAELERSYDLEPSAAASRATEDLYTRVARVVPEPDWTRFAPYVLAINALKKDRDAVILAHNYMTPELFHGVGDVTGDSLQLAIEATRVRQETIVQCGVHFMAETSKVLNPAKRVLIPDSRAGCSLSEGVTPADIEAMRAEYPGAPVVTYVNTSAAVKAVSDVCCTSSNARAVVEAQDAETVIMTPDGYLARNIAATTNKRIVWWEGSCMVHERFTADELRAYRDGYPGVAIVAHPECPPEVLAEADYWGSTSGMISWVKRERPEKVVMVTECSMSDNVAAETPDVEFVRPCNLCPHMKRITLESVLWALHSGEEEVVVADDLIAPAAEAIEKMIEISQRAAT